ncbi:hypothetical protein HN954_01505 [bacterium]|jgi:hypothetical protein|nr:hypothetical protein [bacterium]MBT6832414.1 hypothetical protein [bacterium]MBT6996085.1 hypothetical protein [bacterium]
MLAMLQHFSVIPKTDVKRFLCLDCESRWEEEIVDLANQSVACLHCGSENVLPFSTSAIGQDGGCQNGSCERRVDSGECGSCDGCSGCAV